MQSADPGDLCPAPAADEDPPMKSLFDTASEALNGRREWEQKQRLYYEMRHDGLRRRNKPFPTAADLHFPLIDMTIRKDKPFWEGQAISSERIASFVALKEQQKEITSAAADFFDFELRQNTNFIKELLRVIDTTRFRGRGVIKAIVDPFDDYKIVFEAIDPLMIIMAEGADDFEDADWFVEIQHLSVAKYKRDRRYSQDPAVIARIQGSRDMDSSSEIFQDKEAREGVHYSQNSNTIILWHHWEKTMGGWMARTFSPQAPDLDVRKPYRCPYKVKGKPSLPYFSFSTEVKDKGWYSPRGLAELLAPFESYACKLWNEKADAMTFGNRPVFTSESQIPNTANIRWAPGEFIPGNVKGVQVAQPTFSFDQEISFTRGTAEQVAMLPDFGVSHPGTPNQDKGGPRTATENQRIAQLQQVGTESNGRLFRLDLAKVLRHSWGLVLQFKRAELAYYTAGELRTLPEQALHDAYMIEPDGSADQWNKQLRIQRALQRRQVFFGDPNVNQEVLTRDALAADDPKLALEAFVPSNLAAAGEAEDEAYEITILVQGFPAAVKPNENHATRIFVLLGWLQKMSMTGAPVDPIARQRVQEHLSIHFELLKQTQPEAARQVLQQISGAEQGPSGPVGQMGPMGPMNGPMPDAGGQPPEPGGLPI
jgi:hypothetical protein